MTLGAPNEDNFEVIDSVQADERSTVEVIQYRLLHEYGAQCSYENLNVHKACWIGCEYEDHPEFVEFKRVKQKFLALDKQGQLVFFADSAFSLQMTQQKYPAVQFFFTSEMI